MSKQTFTTGQVLTAAQMTSLQQTAMGGGSTTAKTASYVLVAADAGTVVQMNAAGATTITVNTALFAAGDSVQIQNVGAGVCTVTAGTATVSTSATLALKQYDAGTLYFNTTSAAFFFAVDAADTPLTTTGDIIYSSSGSTAARLGIGSSAQVLTVASGIPSWATASSGGLTLISETTASALSSLSLSSISGSHKQLLLVFAGIRHSATGTVFAIRLNNDSATNYYISGMQASATTFNTAARDLTHLGGDPGGDVIYGWGEDANFGSLSTNVMGSILIDNYASTTKTKNVTWNVSYYQNAGSPRYKAINTSVFYNSTSAITSIDIVRISGTATFSNINDSSIRLYGVS